VIAARTAPLPKADGLSSSGVAKEALSRGKTVVKRLLLPVRSLRGKWDVQVESFAEFFMQTPRNPSNSGPLFLDRGMSRHQLVALPSSRPPSSTFLQTACLHII
jgi:hypothetical protein